MPNFDGGHYFLTALVPLKTGQIEDGPGVFTSPVHALRKILARLPAGPTLQFETKTSPFAKVPGLHFARLVIVDDVAYNGRIGADSILGQIRKIDPVIPQPQDHLPRPYLMVAMDFDVADGSDSSRDTFLMGMWDVLADDIAKVLKYAVGFDKLPPDSDSFATYIADCQIETTMSFNDYYIDPPGLQDWTGTGTAKAAIIAGIVGVVSLLIGLFDLLFGLEWHGLLAYALVFLCLGVLIVAIAAAVAVVTITRRGEAAFPTDPRTTLPNILKALYLQRAFTDFAIANQVNAARDTGEAALHAAFGAFLTTHKPAELGDPTQTPGVLGI